jgi:hypothetical protein
MDLTKLTTIVGLLVALSLASERLVEIIKGLVPWLDLEKKQPTEEGRRRSAIHAIAVVAGIVTAVLALPIIGSVIQLPEPTSLWIVALGLLASGGSSLWNSVLGYLLSVKDIKEQVAKLAKEDKIDLRRAIG